MRPRRDPSARVALAPSDQGHESFYKTITEAIRWISTYGYESEQALNVWLDRIKRAAVRSLVPLPTVEKQVRASFEAIYRRNVQSGAVFRKHKGVGRFTVERLAPQLRVELDRRIAASANLIKLNREQAIDKTLQRFSGWATSVPAGGSKVVDRPEESAHIRKALVDLRYQAQVVAQDQGHKLAAAINDIIAVNGGAIAAVWHSKFRQAGYHARPDHKERDGHCYLIRGDWALEKGLVKHGPAGYTDQITQPAEEVNCFPGDSEVPFADGVSKAFGTGTAVSLPSSRRPRAKRCEEHRITQCLPSMAGSVWAR